MCPLQTCKPQHDLKGGEKLIQGRGTETKTHFGSRSPLTLAPQKTDALGAPGSPEFQRRETHFRLQATSLIKRLLTSGAIPFAPRCRDVRFNTPLRVLESLERCERLDRAGELLFVWHLSLLESEMSIT